MSMRNRLAILAISALVAGCSNTSLPPKERAAESVYPQTQRSAPTREDYVKVRSTVEAALRRELASFYPACVDRVNGGFKHAFPNDWEKLSATDRQKNLVFQARMTWTAAEVARRRPDLREEYLQYARHGFQFLRDKFWDAEHGGFFWQVAENGDKVPQRWDKNSYGIAFGIYTCANVYEATHDRSALDLALKAVEWLDTYGHDDRFGGYFEDFDQQGNRIMDSANSWDPQNPNDVLGYPYGLKSMNTHIHLMEAMTRLVPLQDSALLRSRLDELHLLVRDRMVVRGALHTNFTPDWKPLQMYDSFGHDIETAYLLWEGDIVRHGTPNTKTQTVCRSLVDHALKFGWDDARGGFYYEGFSFGKAHNLKKSWWTQAEGLNALLLMHSVFGKDDPENRYWGAFVRQWGFIQRYQINPNTGGWYAEVGPDGEPTDRREIMPWKASYHSGRAMLNVSDMLRELAERP